MKNIAIIGLGYVGQAMLNYFKDHYEVVYIDPEKEGSAKEHQINVCDMAVICVPTPMRDDGSCDTSIVEKTIEWLAVPLIVIKSTVPPGKTQELIEKYPNKHIVFSPEYIGEGKYYVPTYKGYPHPTDMKQHEFFIFGGKKEDTSDAIDFFMKVSGPDAKYMQTEATTAEMVKYMENSWGAMKVTFCNEFFEIAKIFGVDYKELRELLLLDGRMERMHTAVFEDKRGFGGKCFPKDVNAIVKASEKAGYVPELMSEVLNSNARFNSKNTK